jgi:anti-sigma regulatory factor (Ser/Thr protein kinase)
MGLESIIKSKNIQNHSIMKPFVIPDHLTDENGNNPLKVFFSGKFLFTDKNPESQEIISTCIDPLKGKNECLDYAISALSNTDVPISCFYFETDSSRLGLGFYLYELMEDSISLAGFPSTELAMLPQGYDELYNNCLLHASRAAPYREYERRNILSVFSAKDKEGILAEIEQNKKKKIIVESYITRNFIATRFIDQGKGFDPEKVIIAKDKNSHLSYARGLLVAKDENPEHKRIPNTLEYERHGDEFHVILIKYNRLPNLD